MNLKLYVPRDKRGVNGENRKFLYDFPFFKYFVIVFLEIINALLACFIES